MTDLSELIERVRQATGPDRDVDWRIAMTFDIPEPWRHTAPWPPFAPKSKFEKSIPAFTTSVDAALALVERCLPGWRTSIYGNHMTGAKGGTGWRVQLQSPKKAKPDALGYRWPSTVAECFHAPNAPLAIIIALLLALESQP